MPDRIRITQTRSEQQPRYDAAEDAGANWRGNLAADSQLTGDGLGAATEGAHTAVAIPQEVLGTARRRIKFDAYLYCDSDNAADTWRVRLRLGGLGGALIADSGAFNCVATSGLRIEGEITIRTVGAGGTFDAWFRLYNEVGPAIVEDIVFGGAVDTTAERDLAVTGESSSASAAQQFTLRMLDCCAYED